MFTFEKVRARNFARAWGFVQFSQVNLDKVYEFWTFHGFGSLQALPIAFGVPLAGYINLNSTNNAGYYVCAACSILGSLTLFLVDLHKRNVSKHKDGTIKWVVRLRGKLHLQPSDFTGKMEPIHALKRVESCHLTTITITSQHCKEQQLWFLARKFWWV